MIQEKYRAPEKFYLGTVEKVDIWMAGIVLLMIITGRNLFIEVEKESLDKVIADWQTEHPNFCKLTDLVKHMLDKDPLTRFSAADCLAHPFMV